MAASKKQWLKCLKSILFASLASLGIFLVFSILIVAILKEIENRTLRDAATYVLTMVMYAVFFYRFHMHNRLNTYAEHGATFSPKKELIAYLRSEGKSMLAIYGTVTVVTEISCLIMQNAPRNPVAFASSFCLGPWMLLKIPVLRSVIAFTYSAATVSLLTLLRSRRIYKEEKMSKNK